MPCALGRLIIPVFLLQVSLEWSEIKLLPAGRGVPTGKPRKNYQHFKPDIRDSSTALASLIDFLFYVIRGKSFYSNPPPWAQMTYWPFGVNGLNKLSANFITLHSLLILDPISNGGTKVRRSRCCHQPHMPPASSFLTVTCVFMSLELTRCCCQTACSPGSLWSSSGSPRHTHASAETPPAHAEAEFCHAHLAPTS